MDRKLTDNEIQESKAKRTMEVIARKTAYFRSNPHRFAKEYLGIELKLFQKILIWAMNVNDAFYFVAARSIGKTFLVALYAVIRCILWPGTKIIIAAPSFKQSKEVVEKITNEFMHSSPLLRYELISTSTSRDNCGATFKNGSFIRTVIAGEHGRGKK